MNNYEYIIASLPDITTGWKFGEKGPHDYIEEVISSCTEKDRKLIEFLMSGYLDENPAYHTKIEREYLASHGYDLIDANTGGFIAMQRNDVLWRTGHTGLYIGDGMQAEAIRDENHDAGYEGTEPGDQDGGETVVRPLTLDWDYVIRKRDKPKPVAPIPTDEGETMTFIFSCDSNRHMWLYDGGRVVQIKTESQQEALKEAHMRATGRPMPQFHLANGGALIDLLG